MVYKLDFIYKTHCGTNVTDDVTDNIVVQGCPGSIPGWVLKKKQTTYICILYLICNIYCIYLIYNIYCIYLICILYIYIYCIYM